MAGIGPGRDCPLLSRRPYVPALKLVPYRTGFYPRMESTRMQPTAVYLEEENDEALEGAVEMTAGGGGRAFLWTAEISGAGVRNLCCSNGVESVTGFPAERFNEIGA